MATSPREPGPSVPGTGSLHSPGSASPSAAGTGTATLTSSAAGEFLRAALAEVDGKLLTWRPVQVDHQPARGSTAAYRATVRWPDGRETEERFGAYTGTPPEGALVLDNGAQRVSVWRFPHDPFLPGLAAAYDPAALRALRRELGMGDGPATSILRAYRPRRRAVVEVTGPGGRLFLKAVRPSRVRALHERHRLLTRAGVPAAPSLGYTDAGLLTLQELPGQTLRSAVRGGAEELPPGEAILRLLDLLPAELATGPARRSWRDRAGHYAHVLGDLLPRQARQVGQLAEAIVAEGSTGPSVPVHGDFYESQIRVSGTRVTGLLDIDTAGPGERLDDLACLLGHLSVLSELEPGRSAAIGRLGARYLAAFERTVDPVALRYRVAAVVLSLATGPHRVQEQNWRRRTRYRIELAERWVKSARTLRQGRTVG